MLIALTGAGISKPSGIPTFEELGDLRNKLSRAYAQQCPEEFNLLMDDLRNTCRKALLKRIREGTSTMYRVYVSDTARGKVIYSFTTNKKEYQQYHEHRFSGDDVVSNMPETLEFMTLSYLPQIPQVYQRYITQRFYIDVIAESDSNNFI